MRDQTLGKYLAELADKVPAPGGGAVAALHAAQSAALLEMVANYTTGRKYAEHAEVVTRILAAAAGLRDRALALAEQDAAAFGVVAAAYQLPRESDLEKQTRSAAIAEALVGAAEPPATVIEVAAELVALAEELLPIGNRNVLTDVAAAADAARAAATTARVNVEVNTGAEEGSAAGIATRADAVSAAVRESIRR